MKPFHFAMAFAVAFAASLLIMASTGMLGGSNGRQPAILSESVPSPEPPTKTILLGEREYLTMPTAILCVDKYSLKDSLTAASRGDQKWLKELGCSHARSGLRVYRIEPDTASPFDPWKVRVETSDGGITLWGYGSNFMD